MHDCGQGQKPSIAILLQKFVGVNTYEDVERLEMHTEFWSEKLNTWSSEIQM